MGSQQAVDEHLAVDAKQICNRRQAVPRTDPEDGITTLIEATLNERKAGSKVDAWESLWHVLFPRDTEIPEPRE
jgi:hypothetical protein